MLVLFKVIFFIFCLGFLFCLLVIVCLFLEILVELDFNLNGKILVNRLGFFFKSFVNLNIIFFLVLFVIVIDKKSMIILD